MSIIQVTLDSVFGVRKRNACICATKRGRIAGFLHMALSATLTYLLTYLITYLLNYLITYILIY